MRAGLDVELGAVGLDQSLGQRQAFRTHRQCLRPWNDA
jgi:hypothetical protein